MLNKYVNIVVGVVAVTAVVGVVAVVVVAVAAVVVVVGVVAVVAVAVVAAVVVVGETLAKRDIRVYMQRIVPMYKGLIVHAQTRQREHVGSVSRMTNSTTKAPGPPSTVASLSREYPDKNTKAEYCWLENVQKILALASDDEENSVNQSVDNMSWAAYHANQEPAGRNVICPSALLPLFHESANTVAMVKHAMDVVGKAVQHLNIEQRPVMTFDHPFYAFDKQIQWKWPEMYGQDKFVVMFGVLHIEMAALRTMGDWLQGSG